MVAKPALSPPGKGRYFAEFAGTFVLVFVSGCSVLAGDRIWHSMTVAAALAVMNYAVHDISGAFFNPAVSLAMGLCKRTPWAEVAKFVGVQFVAGVLASFSYSFVLWQVFSLEPGLGYGMGTALPAEMLYTCMLCFVYLHVAGDSVMHHQYHGLAVGFAYLAGALSIGHITGAIMNPATALAIDLSSKGYHVLHMWCPYYAASELLGACLAYGLYAACGSVPLLAESVGTFFLTLTLGLNVLGNSPAVALAVGAAFTCLAFALYDVSGAHLNPALTLAAACRKQLSMTSAACYVASQLLGAALGAFAYVGLEHWHSFRLDIGIGYRWPQVFVGEMIFTFLLCLVYLSVQTIKENFTEFGGLAVGGCVLAGGVAIGRVSGGLLNPALALAVALTGWCFHGGSLLIVFTYLISQFAGGACAAGLSIAMRPLGHRALLSKGA